MPLQITANGIEIQTYDEILADVTAAYQLAYGPDINLEPNSPDGQRIANEVKARLDLQSFGLSIANGMDPDLADGELFNKLLKLSGTYLRPATKSQVDVDITVDRTLTLDIGYTVDDTLGQPWVLATSTPLTAGTTSVTLFAESFGAIEADAATVTDPATIVPGVVSVTNPLAAVIGSAEETVPEARIRRQRSLELPAASSLGGLYSAVGNLPGVTDLVAYENDQDTYDAVRDMVGHSIWLVVEGGEISDIVYTMAVDKTAGTAKKGTVTGTYSEPRDRPGGGTYYIVHSMAFDRPTYTPLHIRLDVTSRDGSTVDTAAIEAALATHVYRIAENAIASALYADAYSAGTNFIATSLEVSSDGVTWTDGREIAGYDVRFTLDAANITVTDITP